MQLIPLTEENKLHELLKIHLLRKQALVICHSFGISAAYAVVPAEPAVLLVEGFQRHIESIILEPEAVFGAEAVKIIGISVGIFQKRLVENHRLEGHKLLIA